VTKDWGVANGKTGEFVGIVRGGGLSRIATTEAWASMVVTPQMEAKKVLIGWPLPLPELDLLTVTFTAARSLLGSKLVV
jgi:hypothetical protein